MCCPVQHQMSRQKMHIHLKRSAMFLRCSIITCLAFTLHLITQTVRCDLAQRTSNSTEAASHIQRGGSICIFQVQRWRSTNSASLSRGDRHGSVSTDQIPPGNLRRRDAAPLTRHTRKSISWSQVTFRRETGEASACTARQGKVRQAELKERQKDQDTKAQDRTR